MEGRSGTGAKGDCIVTVAPGSGMEVSVLAKSQRLLGTGLRAITEETVVRLGVSDVSVEVNDLGALDYVIAARIETAIRAVHPETAPISPVVTRAPSERDRPRRSRLYAPGNNPRLSAGIDIHGADCVLLDLEDSVPLGEKAAARILVKHLLAAVPFPEEAWVRINPLDAGGREDVAEVLRGRPHGICLPKAESARDVLDLDDELSRIEAERGIEEGATWILPIIETARGVLRAEEIAAASGRVVMLAFGAEDFTRDVGARRTSEALLFARSQIVAAAAAAGVQASDTVYADLSDMEGLVEEANLARELGFDGKGAINPRQIEPIHRAFSPTEEELEQARAIVAAAREAEAQGLGAVALDGKMIDRPVLERAQRVMKYAEKLTKGGDRDA
jgi:citrate lyase subunit beta/citryl-CoA lyase